jgi:hypothetical protein
VGAPLNYHSPTMIEVSQYAAAMAATNAVAITRSCVGERGIAAPCARSRQCSRGKRATKRLAVLVCQLHCRTGRCTPTGCPLDNLRASLGCLGHLRHLGYLAPPRSHRPSAPCQSSAAIPGAAQGRYGPPADPSTATAPAVAQPPSGHTGSPGCLGRHVPLRSAATTAPRNPDAPDGPCGRHGVPGPSE